MLSVWLFVDCYLTYIIMYQSPKAYCHSNKQNHFCNCNICSSFNLGLPARQKLHTRRTSAGFAKYHFVIYLLINILLLRLLYMEKRREDLQWRLLCCGLWEQILAVDCFLTLVQRSVQHVFLGSEWFVNSKLTTAHVYCYLLA